MRAMRVTEKMYAKLVRLDSIPFIPPTERDILKM
jgi:hypothetical protein